jgi:hypothetical protein
MWGRLVLLVLITSAQPLVAQHTLHIVAYDTNVWQLSPGHAFMIIDTPTRTGIKEEPFGFNTREEHPGLKGKVEMYVGVPGALKSEWRIPRPALDKVAVSVDIPITDDQRKAIYATMEKWNMHRYEATTSNCIDFINDVAQVVGLPNVDRYKTQLPKDYVASLKKAYAQKQADDKQRRIDEARRRQKAEANRCYIRVWNVDDKITVYLNGKAILSVQDGNDSGTIELPVHQGTNDVTLRLFNTVPQSPVTFSYVIWKGNSEVCSDTCGTYHQPSSPCMGGKRFAVQQVWERHCSLEVSGTD